MGKKVADTQNNVAHPSQTTLGQDDLTSDTIPAILRDVMNKNVVTIAPSESTVAAAKKMTENRITCMVVTENDNILGIVTHNDFIKKLITKNEEFENPTVAQIMTSPVINLCDNAGLVEAGQMMSQRKVKHLPVVNNGKLVGIVTQADVFRTAQAALEEQLRQVKAGESQAKAELEHANLKLEAETEKKQNDEHEAVIADLAKNHFLANMSHEIRTPLNAIIGLSEVLNEEALTEEQHSYLSIIRESAQNMMVLIKDILDFSKIEAGKFNLDIAECSLEHLLAVLESIMRPQAMQKDLDFGIFQRTDLPALIKTDSMRLRQCLNNLLNNAIDFTEKGHVYLNVSLEKHQDIDCIRFDIEDTGIGIAKQDHEKIFREFTQAAVTKNRKSAGAGLGLTITKKLVHLLGGKVLLQSKVGSGSTFSIIIPAGLDVKSQPVFNKSDQLKKVHKEKPSTEDGSLSGKVLVAEDTPTNQTLIKLLLNKLGLDVVIAEDGQEALNRALTEDFDIILMDIQMPHMNGYDATKKLREAGFEKPIVAVTAHAMQGDKEKCLAAGCDDYISKPINKNQLVDVLKTYLQPSGNLIQQINDAADQVEQLTQICDNANAPQQDTAVPENTKQRQSLSEDFDSSDLIDFQAVKKICDDLEVIKEVVEMFLKDSPRCIKSIAEAIKNANPKHIKMYAHSLKGAALQIGAKKLADIAYQLECAGRDKDMSNVPVLFNTVQDEYSQLKLLLSQPNWIELTKNTTN